MMERWLLVCVSVALLAASLAAFLVDWLHSPTLAVVTGSVAVALAVRLSPRGWASPASLYLLVYVAFHCGLLVSELMGWEVSIRVSGFSVDISSPEIIAASALTSIGASAVAVGVVLVARSRISPVPKPESHAGLAVVGGVLLYGGVLGWLLLLLANGGLALIYQGYLAWLGATVEAWPSSAIVYLAIGLGLPCVVAGSSAGPRRLALTVFVLWSLPALAIGLRGEVLLPALAALIVEARRRPLPWRWFYAAWAVAGLALGALIRVGRQGAGWSSAALSPVDGLAEMGYSIRPVVMSWVWHVPGTEPFVGWGTYWAWVDRVIGRLLGTGTLTAESDPRVFNSVVLERVGAIGGSPVAEAFRANGVVAVVLVMSIVGMVLAGLDRVAAAPLPNALVGGTAFILLLWVRNSFTPVLAQMLLLGGALLVAYLVEALTASDRRRISARYG